ncbi:DUF2975 domain-containing protein, partial [Bacillus wiedmannii]
MKQGSTLFLKTAIILIGIPVFALCIFLIPNIGNYAADLYPDIAYIKYLVLINLYAT